MSDFYIPGSGIYPDVNDSYYGAYRTRTFSDIFPSYEVFEKEYKESQIKIEFNESLTLAHIFYMLYAHYGNSHIAYTDETQFKYYLYSIIFQYGPTVIKERYIQDKLRKLSDDELLIGGKAVYNHAYNPGTAPQINQSTGSPAELTYINDQNTTNYKKSMMEGYAMLMSLLKKDVIDEFIHKFKRLFIKVLAPDYPLLYETEVE